MRNLTFHSMIKYLENMKSTDFLIIGGSAARLKARLADQV